jgi:hypothetical protein
MNANKHEFGRAITPVSAERRHAEDCAPYQRSRAILLMLTPLLRNVAGDDRILRLRPIDLAF